MNSHCVYHLLFFMFSDLPMGKWQLAFKLSIRNLKNKKITSIFCKIVGTPLKNSKFRMAKIAHLCSSVTVGRAIVEQTMRPGFKPQHVQNSPRALVVLFALVTKKGNKNDCIGGGLNADSRENSNCGSSIHSQLRDIDICLVFCLPFVWMAGMPLVWGGAMIRQEKCFVKRLLLDT